MWYISCIFPYILQSDIFSMNGLTDWSWKLCISVTSSTLWCCWLLIKTISSFLKVSLWLVLVILFISNFITATILYIPPGCVFGYNNDTTVITPLFNDKKKWPYKSGSLSGGRQFISILQSQCICNLAW